MWRLWNTVAKGFRSTAARSYRENIGPDEHTNVFPLRQNLRAINNETSNKTEAQGFAENFPSRPLKDYTLAEAVGLGTALAFGWQLCHGGRNSRATSPCKNPSLFDTVTKIAFAQPDCSSTKLHITEKPKSSASLNTVAENTTLADNDSKTSENSEKSLLPEMMKVAEKDLFCGDDLVMGDLQNEAGVQLLLAAEQNGKTGDSELDQLLNLGNGSACQREAFTCFEEASKRGSVKAKFNLGLCYEQGIGARKSLSMAVLYYEEAAREGHAAAQYNLGLLHYSGRVPGKAANHEQAIQLWRQSASQGLEEAWTALATVLSARNPPDQWEEGSTVSLNLIGEAPANSENSGNFRKSRSEPHDLSNLSSTLPGNLIVIR